MNENFAKMGERLKMVDVSPAQVARGINMKEGKMSYNSCNSMKCPQCGSTTDPIIPSVSSDTKERHYCPLCKQHFYAIHTGAGTTIQPDKYLVREI